MKRRVLLGGAFVAAAMLGARIGHGAELISYRRGSWADLLARHAGRRTIVHFWGLTCGPCLEELPAWGDFAKGLTGTDLVLVAADPMPQRPAWLFDTLNKAGLSGVENWQFQERFSDALFWEVDHSWQGELPFTVRVAADGTVTGDVGEADFGELKRWVA